MAKKLFVGNLAYAITDDQLTQIFSAYGTVVSAKVISDRFSGRSKGFGFVEFTKDEEAAAAMQALDGSDQEGRNMVVKEANPPREEGGMTVGAPPAPAPVTDEPEEAVEEETPVVEAEEAPEAPAETEEEVSEAPPAEPEVEEAPEADEEAGSDDSEE